MVAAAPLPSPDVGSVDHVSTISVLIAMAPLLGLAWISHQMGLQLEKAIGVGAVRSFLQLSALGFILMPIFRWGHEHWWIVVLYCCFMVLLASGESLSRCKYTYEGLWWDVLTSLLGIITILALFTFGLVLHPKPHWNPQYVIPVIGMLLGNSTSAISVTINATITAFVERTAEIELHLAFGAQPWEATQRLVRDAVRLGATPILNNMAVIGLISIPGMMTGQILAGSPVMEAARYQMLIIYIISITVFGVILSMIGIIQRVAFAPANKNSPSTEGMLRENRFVRQENSLLEILRFRIRNSIFSTGGANAQHALYNQDNNTDNTRLTGEEESDEEVLPLHSSSRGIAQAMHPAKSLNRVMELETIMTGRAIINDTLENSSTITTSPLLQIIDLSRNYYTTTTATASSSSSSTWTERIVFQGMNFAFYSGSIVVIRGPSGSGKTQLLKTIARLVPHKSGQMLLRGRSCSTIKATDWRRQVRYVSQQKIDIPGTPLDYITKLTSFRSWMQQCDTTTPSLVHCSADEFRRETIQYCIQFGIEEECLAREWKFLSGGEAQRIHLAMALASRPQLLLLDESTSALDAGTKYKVEDCIRQEVTIRDMAVVWISHDEEQIQRLRRRNP